MVTSCELYTLIQYYIQFIQDILFPQLKILSFRDIIELYSTHIGLYLH